MKQELQQQVAKFLAQSRVVRGQQGFVHLVRLFDEVRAKRFVSLRGVPVAAASQIAHQRERIFKRGFHLLGLRWSRILRGPQIINQCNG